MNALFLTYRKRLQQLPDKGKRIQDTYEKVVAEINRRNDVDATANLLGELNIASKGKTALNNLEWNGHSKSDDSSHVDDVLDSDDEQEIDPLRIIAKGTMHERQVKVLPPPATLITAEDLLDIESFKQGPDTPDSALVDQSLSSNASSKDTSETIAAEIIEIDAAKLKEKHISETTFDQHARYLIDKTEVQATKGEREKFKPFRTTVSNVHDPSKERARKKGKYWEVTAATPPLIQHKEIQLVPLTESANLQMDYMQKIRVKNVISKVNIIFNICLYFLQDIRMKQAEERLARHSKTASRISMPDDSVIKTKDSFRNYRDPQANYLIEGRQRSSEQNEVMDPTITEKASTGISYTVYE